MKGLYLENQQLTFRNDLPLPDLSENEALIRLKLAGICATDLEMVKGYYPFTGVLGHEFVGEVVEAPGNRTWIGERVVGEINITCGICSACLSGMPTHCVSRQALGIHNYNGVFSEYFKLPVKNLWKVPPGVKDEQAVFTELLAAALEIQDRVLIRPSDRVVVVGAGRLGLLIAQCLKLTGCDLTVVIRRPEPQRLLDKWGIKAAYAHDLSEKSADVVVEVTGSPGGFVLSRSLVRPRGTLVLKSTFAGEVPVNLSGVVVDEISIVGSRCGPFGAALRLLDQNAVDVLPMIDQIYPLEDGLMAIKSASEPGTLKILLRS